MLDEVSAKMGGRGERESGEERERRRGRVVRREKGGEEGMLWRMLTYFTIEIGQEALELGNKRKMRRRREGGGGGGREGGREGGRGLTKYLGETQRAYSSVWKLYDWNVLGLVKRGQYSEHVLTVEVTHRPAYPSPGHVGWMRETDILQEEQQTLQRVVLLRVDSLPRPETCRRDHVHG